MNDEKEGQDINEEIPKDGQQQTLCSRPSVWHSCQSMHMARPHRQTWSQFPLLHQQYDKLFANEVASATNCKQQKHRCFQ
jgi:hypothetical protein